MVNFDALINKLYAVYFRLTTVPADFRTYLSNQLQAGYSQDQMLSDVFRSPTVEREVLPIMRLYRVVFGRKADTGGLDQWAAVYRSMGDASGYTIGNIGNFVQNYWSTTAEYLSRFPATMSSSFFVTQLYNDSLGRNPSASELSTWVNRLESGVYRRADMLAAVAASTEFRGRFDGALERQLKEAFAGRSTAYTGTLIDHDVAA